MNDNNWVLILLLLFLIVVSMCFPNIAIDVLEQLVGAE